MSPEYGATCGFFPVDEETLDYLRLTGRPQERVELVEAYCKQNALWHEPDDHPEYSQVVELDLGDVEPSLAGPRRPQDRVPLSRRRRPSSSALGPSASTTRTAPRTRRSRTRSRPATRRPSRRRAPSPRPEPDRDGPARRGRRARRAGRACEVDGEEFELEHGAVVIAAITSCTNTSNPQVMVAAGAAREERGRARPAPQAVGQVEPRAGLEGRHRVLRQRRPDARTSRSSASTPSATAARPASGTRGRCRRRSRRRSTRAISSSAPSCPATATSRRASTRR